MCLLYFTWSDICDGSWFVQREGNSSSERLETRSAPGHLHLSTNTDSGVVSGFCPFPTVHFQLSIHSKCVSSSSLTRPITRRYTYLIAVKQTIIKVMRATCCSTPSNTDLYLSKRSVGSFIHFRKWADTFTIRLLIG